MHTHTHTHNQPRKKQRNKETKKGREIKMAPLPSCFFGAIYLLLLLLLFAGCDTLCVCVCLCYVRILYFCFRWLFRKHRQLPLLSPPPLPPPTVGFNGGTASNLSNQRVTFDVVSVHLEHTHTHTVGEREKTLLYVINQFLKV